MNKSESLQIQSEFRRILFSVAGLSADSSVVVGVSGGVDSMVMLRMLQHEGLRINVVHVNYHKRAEASDADEELVRDACSQIGAYLEVVHWDSSQDLGGNFQDAARQFRRERFQKVMHETGSEAILLGHNKDDLYETLIMRVLRGAAPSNWNALPEVDLPYVRPLVTTTRAEIEQYANMGHFVWREDESNRSSVYARNFLRNDLIPEMDRLYPGWKSNVERIKMYGDTYRMAIDQLLQPFGDASKLPVEWLSSIDEPLSSAIIHRIHERKGLPVTLSQPESILSLTGSQPGRMVELDELVAWHRDHDSIVLDLKVHDKVAPLKFNSSEVNGNPMMFDYGCVSSSDIKPSESFFSVSAVAGSYMLRSSEAGDRLRISGGSKAVSDLLNEWGVPWRLKPRAYVLTLDGSVVAVIFSHPGYQTRWRIDPDFRCISQICLHFSIFH